MLFAPLPTGGQHNQQRLGKAHANAMSSSKATNDDIAGLIAWINATATALSLPDRVPHVAGVGPKVLSSQFRRTLAWFIARRPGGSIASAIAYRHHSADVRGLRRNLRLRIPRRSRGRTRPGTRRTPPAHGRAARAPPHGRPRRPEARARIEEFGRRAGFTGIVSTDRRQMLKLICRHEPHVYPGSLVTCVHNPDRALCADGRQAPSLIECQPLTCRNAAFSKQNTAAWQTQLSAIDEELAKAALAPYIAHRLAGRRAQVSKVTGRQTRYRHRAGRAGGHDQAYPVPKPSRLVADFLDRAAVQHRAAPSRRTVNQQVQNRLGRLRQENEDLRRHVAIYEDHIRRLATGNARLRDELGRLSGVGDLTARRQRRDPAPR